MEPSLTSGGHSISLTSKQHVYLTIVTLVITSFPDDKYSEFIPCIFVN